MGGENWETRLGRSRAGLLRSPRDLHFVFATFGALQSLRTFALLALLGTALATLGRSRALLAGYVQASQVRYQGAPKAGRIYVEIVGLQKLVGIRNVVRPQFVGPVTMAGHEPAVDILGHSSCPGSSRAC